MVIYCIGERLLLRTVNGGNTTSVTIGRLLHPTHTHIYTVKSLSYEFSVSSSSTPAFDKDATIVSCLC